MRVWWSLLLGIALYASAIDERIIGLIGPRAFEQNRLILNTVFLDIRRYKKDGFVDMVEVARILERLGLLPQTLPTPVHQEVRFFSYNNPTLFFRLSEKALQEAYIFNYAITNIQKDEDGVVEAFTFTSASIPDPVRIGSFLRAHGIKVLDIKHQNGRWSYTLDSAQATLGVPKVEGRTETAKGKSAIWLDVAGLSSVVILAKGGDHWFPKIFVYDRFLHPLQRIERPGPAKRLELTLPNGSYYIKISDRFTAKNIKNGFVILPK